MIKKLTKHGNSMALVIDKGVLELLKIDNTTPLEITTDGKSLLIAPIRNTEEEEEFQSALKKTNKLYGKMLKRLAN